MLTIISHKNCLLHDMGHYHPECPARITTINDALKTSNLLHQTIHATAATKEQLLLAHPIEHINYIYTSSPNTGTFILDPDCTMNKHTLTAALYAVGSIIQAVDVTMNKANQAVFCNIRPPGHHAEAAQAMGFCFFNNLAIGVNYALQQYNINRIAIVDFDVHHGNGTQDILQNNGKILFCSSYQHPFYPNRFTTETENTIHIQMSAGTTSKQYRELVKTHWLEQLNKFNPEMLFFSAGFDAHQHDPLASINLTTDDYYWLTKEITQATCDFTNNKVISTLEGGYNIDILGEAVLAHLSVLKN